MNRRAFTLLALCALWQPAAYAQEWPTKPVRIIVPYAPGGTADTLGRIVANKLTTHFKQNFIVENRPGAGGVIGSELVANAAPDGYTLLVSGIGSHVIAPSVSDVPWDTMKSFTHIALFGGPPTALVVNPSLPAQNVAEYAALTRSRPEGLSYGSPGGGTHAHLIGEMFRAQTGSNLTHIPYKGASLAIADLVAGHLPSTFTTLSTAAPQVKAGKVRALAVTSAKRVPDFPDVPTFNELGFKDMVATTWFSLSGPAGLPQPIVTQLNAEVRRALHSPDVRERVRGEGVESNDLDAAAFTEFMRRELERWRPFAKMARGTH